MTQKELANVRLLYRPSWRVESIALEVIQMFDKPLSNGIIIDSISLKEGALSLAGLKVKKIVRDKKYQGAVEIHWFPDYTISTTSDPFCSVFMLKYHSIQKLSKWIKKFYTNLETTLNNQSTK